MAKMGLDSDKKPISLQHAQSKILPPVSIRWPKVFYKSQTWKNGDICKETSFEASEIRLDSMVDAKSQEGISSIRQEVAENAYNDATHATINAYNVPKRVEVDAYFDPKHVGSYPSKPSHMLLSLGIKALDGSGLEVLEEDEDAKAQPEKDMEALGKTRSKRETTFVLPLDLFHNQELELCHPSIDIEMVCV